MDRRTFLKGSLIGLGMAGSGATLARAQAASVEKPKAALKLSSQLGQIPGRSLKEKADNIAKFGGQALELGGGFNPKDVLEALRESGIKVSAICAADGPYIVADEAQRRRAVDNAKRILERAGEVGSTGVIMVPAFNGKKDQLWGGEAHRILVDQLLEMGEVAAKAGTFILLEPLNNGEAWFLRNLASASFICRECEKKNPEAAKGVGMMGDFYHMHIEETSDCGAFLSAGKYLKHVHLATRSRARAIPHWDNSDYRDGFRGLKMIGYQGYCSLECGMRGDPMVEVKKCFDYLKKQWEEATV